MYSNKIKICADVHLCEEYYMYIKQTLEHFIKEVKEDKPRIVVISGDYFEHRIHGDEDIYNIAINYLIEISNYCKYLIVLQGTFSHDYNTLNILNTLKKVKNNIYFFKLLNEFETEEGEKILLLPEDYPENPNEYYKESFNKKYDFIFGHGDIEGALLHAGIDNRRLNGFKFNPTTLSEMAEFIVFGHIHKHQFLKSNVCYPGSLGRWKHGEEEDKGYIDIDLDSRLMKFIPLSAFEFKTKHIENEEDLNNLKLELNNLDNVDIKIKISEDLKDRKKEITELLENTNKLKFEYLKEDVQDNDLIYGNISGLSIEEQYMIVYNTDKDNKKITKKDLNSVLSENNFKKYLNIQISETLKEENN